MFARIIILWLVWLLRAQAAMQSVTVNYDDHSSRTFQYLAETGSNLIVKIAGQPVFLPRTNIVSLQIFSGAVPASATPAASAPTRLEPKAQASRASQINAAIERWGLAGLAVLFFVRAIWRFRTEGEFYGHRIALFVYLGMLAVLVAGGLGGWGNGFLQMGALALVLLFGQFYTNPDLVERRSGLYFWLGVLVLAGLAGAGLGYYFWSHSEKLFRPDIVIILCAIVASAWPLYKLAEYLNISLGDFIGGLRADMLLSEGAFAEKNKAQVHLPSDRLLVHWRENGMIKQAWQTARKHLLDDPMALPIWLFALETAALHRKNPAEATALLRRLWQCKNFTADQKNIALMKMHDLAMKIGFQFSEKDFHHRSVARKEKPLARILELRQKGRFAEAESVLLALVEKEPDNAAAITQLVRLYAEDLKLRGKAQHWVSQAEDHLPSYHVDFLRNSLAEWICSDSTATGKFAANMPGRSPAASSGKLVLNSVKGSSAPVENSVEDCLQRQPIIKNPAAASEPYRPPRDKVDELVVDHRYGSAEEILKQELKAKPEDFDLWLRYAEVHGRHCGNLRAAEKVIEKMFQLRMFSEEQMQTARASLKEWRSKHPVGLSSW